LKSVPAFFRGRFETIIQTYDGLNRPLVRTLSPTDITINTYDEERSGYHNMGRLTTAQNSAGHIQYDFDIAGRLLKE